MSENELSVIELDTNLADVEKPPELPPGKYAGEVQDVQVNTSGKGNQYFAIKFVIPNDQIPADMAEHYEDGAVLYWNRQLVPKGGNDRRTLYNLRKFIEALGLSSKTTAIDPNEWMGQRATLVIKHGKDLEGNLRAEIGSILPGEQEAPKREEKAVRGRARR
jgi:hypothetical protein